MPLLEVFQVFVLGASTGIISYSIVALLVLLLLSKLFNFPQKKLLIFCITAIILHFVDFTINTTVRLFFTYHLNSIFSFLKAIQLTRVFYLFETVLIQLLFFIVTKFIIQRAFQLKENDKSIKASIVLTTVLTTWNWIYPWVATYVIFSFMYLTGGCKYGC